MIKTINLKNAMIKINCVKENLVFKFPQDASEISSETLVELTKNYTLGKGKVLLCLIGSYNLFALRTAIKGSKDVDTVVNPIIAKVGDDVTASFDFHVGSTAIIAPSDVERGIHVDVNCGASYSNLRRLIKTYNDFGAAIINNEIVDEDDNPVTEIYALSFKIVNAYDIAATISAGDKNDIFVEPIQK